MCVCACVRAHWLSPVCAQRRGECGLIQELEGGFMLPHNLHERPELLHSPPPVAPSAHTGKSGWEPCLCTVHRMCVILGLASITSGHIYQGKVSTT